MKKQMKKIIILIGFVQFISVSSFAGAGAGADADVSVSVKGSSYECPEPTEKTLDSQPPSDLCSLDSRDLQFQDSMNPQPESNFDKCYRLKSKKAYHLT